MPEQSTIKHQLNQEVQNKNSSAKAYSVEFIVKDLSFVSENQRILNIATRAQYFNPQASEEKPLGVMFISVLKETRLCLIAVNSTRKSIGKRFDTSISLGLEPPQLPHKWLRAQFIYPMV